MKRFSKSQSKQMLLFIYSYLVGVSQLLLYFADNRWISLLAFSIFGMSLGLFIPVANTIFQMKVENKYQGRFFTFQDMIERMVLYIFMLLIGYLLDLIGFYALTLSLGFFTLGITFLLSINISKQAHYQEISR